MTDDTAQPLTTLEMTLGQIRRKRSNSIADLTISGGFSLLGLGIAVTAPALFPVFGAIASTAGLIVALAGGARCVRETMRLYTLGKGEREVTGGVSDAFRDRSKTLSEWNDVGEKLSLFAAGGIAVFLGAAFAPALVSTAAVMSIVSAIAFPALALMAAVKALDGAAKGAEEIVLAVDNPDPKKAQLPTPPQVSAEPAADKGLRSKLRPILGVFKSKAAPAVKVPPEMQVDAAAPQIKPVIPMRWPE